MRFIPIPCFGELHTVGGDGAVFHEDFRDAAGRLIERYSGSARVVYIDPPFNTGGYFEYRRGKKQTAYCDSMPKDEYLAMMRSAIELSKKLLREDGTFFLHVDCRMSAHLRLICDEVFTEDAFTNEIIWAYKSGGRSKKNFSAKHDVILMYRMSPDSYFDPDAVAKPRGAKRRNHMKRGVDEKGRVFYSIRTGGREYRYYEDDPVYPSDVWDDIEHLNQRDPERTGFITQKPEALLKRVILSCSEEGDLVVDLFGGSGTTAVTAAKLGRSFVSVDSGAAASAITEKRLLERSLKLRLYETQKPLSVEGDGREKPCPDPEKYFECGLKGGAACLKLRKLPKEVCPYMLARGTVANGVFTAVEYDLEPKFGDEFRLADGECLMIVDEDFVRHFVGVSD